MPTPTLAARARSIALATACLTLVPPALAQTVTNVRAQQLPDKTVEVLYDLSGAVAPGAVVTVAFSSDGGTTYGILPAGNTLTGDVGGGIGNGTNRRIVWNAPLTLAPGTFGTTFRAAVTATSAGANAMTVTLPNGVPLDMVRIPGGTVTIGSPPGERNRGSDETQHTQVITKDYWIGKYEVTQAQWEAVTGTQPVVVCGGSSGLGPNYPVYCVSWNDITGPGGFIEKLNLQQGTTKFRLPTEAEWENAARGGTGTRFSFGDALDCSDVSCTDCSADSYAWYCSNNQGESGSKLVGGKNVNPNGIFDVHGNIQEWCQDWYAIYSLAPPPDYAGPATGSSRVFRGGGWGSVLGACRSAWRGFSGPTARNADLGFRLARSL